jgi:hypothetical protein
MAAVLRRLKRVEYDFHVCAFGEEMARMNFLPLAERRRYVAEEVGKASRLQSGPLPPKFATTSEMPSAAGGTPALLCERVWDIRHQYGIAPVLVRHCSGIALEWLPWVALG